MADEKEYDEIFDRFDPFTLESAFKQRMELEKGKYKDRDPCDSPLIWDLNVSGCDYIKRFWLCPEDGHRNTDDDFPILKEHPEWAGGFLNARSEEDIEYVNKFCKMRNNFGKYLHQALKGVNDRLTVPEIADRLSEVTEQSEEIGIPIRMKENHLRKYLEEAVNSGVLDVKPRSYSLAGSQKCPHCEGELPEGMRLPDYPYEEVMPHPDNLEED